MARAKAGTPITPRPKVLKGTGKGVDLARAKGKETCSAAKAALVDVNKPLTDMQKEFVRQWAQGESITTATARAGFADTGVGYRLARQPNVLAYKATFEKKYEEAAQMSRKKVMDMHMEAFEMAKLRSEPASMVSAARELGKMCGYYAPVEVKMKVDVQGNIVANQLNAMTDAELLEAITQGQTLELTHEQDGV